MEHLEEFRLIFTDVLVEALPFLTLAALASFLFEMFLPEDFFRRLFAGRALAGVFIAAAAGFVFPISEYCIVPIARKLHERGVPLPVALTLMMAGPSLSPLVVAGTAVAFSSDINLAYWRFGLAFPLVAAMGVIMVFIVGRGRPLRGRSAPDPLAPCSAMEPADYGSMAEHGASMDSVGLTERFRAGFDAAVDDFIRMLGFLVFACAMTAGIQAFIPHSLVHPVEVNSALGAPAMMLIAFVTSTASESDAFIAAAFAHLSRASKLAFLLLGPVIDLKLVLAHFALLPRRAAVALFVIFPLLVVIALVVVERFV